MNTRKGVLRLNETGFEPTCTLDDQLSILIDNISLSESDMEKSCEPVCRELSKNFLPIFPKCKIYRFGSTQIGLGLKNSDLDIYMKIGIPVVKKSSNCTGPHALSIHELFTVVQNVLHNHCKSFVRICPVPNANIPIIKVTYKPTNISCDISFKNDLALSNTELVKFYLQINQSFRSAMIIIKYWIQKCNLKSKTCITNYALVMLFIFYLQQQKMVPPISHLKTKCPIPVFIEGWQINFSKNLFTPSLGISKTVKIIELLQGFFEFYAVYDFENNVVCPLDGNTHPKNEYVATDNRQENMVNHKKYLENEDSVQILTTWKPMCIQDPIQLNRNITNSIELLHVEKFKTYCMIIASLIKMSSNNDYEDLLPKMENLFGETNVENLRENHKKTITFSVYPSGQTFLNFSGSEWLRQRDWFRFTINIVVEYLKEVLNLQVKLEHADDELSIRYTEDSLDTRSKDNRIILICKGYHCLWRNRKHVKVATLKSTLLQHETEVTRVLLREINLTKNDSSFQDLILDFECYLLKRKEPQVNLTVTLEDKGCHPQVFQELSNYLSTKLPSFIRKCCNEFPPLSNSNDLIPPD